jgi:hypothetical protein
VLACLSYKFKYPKHVAMIGNGKTLHTVFGGFFEHAWYTGGTIQQ